MYLFVLCLFAVCWCICNMFVYLVVLFATFVLSNWWKCFLNVHLKLRCTEPSRPPYKKVCLFWWQTLRVRTFYILRCRSPPPTGRFKLQQIFPKTCEVQSWWDQSTFNWWIIFYLDCKIASLTFWYVFLEMQACLRPEVQSGGENQRVRPGVGLQIVSAGNLIYHMPSSHNNKGKLAIIATKTRNIIIRCWESYLLIVCNSENKKNPIDNNVI